MFAARGQAYRQLRSQALVYCDPSELLASAIQDFRRFGNQDRLTMAADLMVDLGPRAQQALAQLSSEDPEEAAPFTLVIPMLGLSEEYQAALLGRFAKSRHAAVRRNAAQAAEYLAPGFVRGLLRRLAHDADGEVRASALEALEHHDE